MSPASDRGEGRGPGGGQYVFDFREILQLLRRRMKAILLVVVLLVGAVVGLSFLQTPVYESSIRILVGQQQGIAEDPLQVSGLQQITQTVSELIGTTTVAESVIEQTGLQATPEEFLQSLDVQQVTNTQLIEVTYRDTDPEQARQTANAIGAVFSDQISNLEEGQGAFTATVWEQASAPDAPVSPDPIRNGILALALGLMVGVGVAFLLEYFDDSWRSAEEAERVSGVPTFGMIPTFADSRKDRERRKRREVKS